MDALKDGFLPWLVENQALKPIYFKINLFYWGLLQWTEQVSMAVLGRWAGCVEGWKMPMIRAWI